MAKHIIEETALNSAGFNLVSIGEVDIAAVNSDRRLELRPEDNTIDINIHDNKVLFRVRVPFFKTNQW